jgi:hypothetical protein
MGMNNPTLWDHPFTCILGGPSGSGKTHFVIKLLIHYRSKIKPIPAKITYYLSEWQPLFNEIKAIIPFMEFKEGLPSIDAFDNTNQLIILDDLMSETKDNEDILNLFTKKSHHRNISIILMTQNIYCKGACMRSMSLNSHYLVVFNNPRDRSQIKYLSRQINPSFPKYIEEAFFDATTIRPHGYILFDLKQRTPENLRIKANIFNENN